VLSYIVEISVFLPVAIAGLRFTVNGGGEPRKNISKIKRAFSGNRQLATVNQISMLNNMPVLFNISRR